MKICELCQKEIPEDFVNNLCWECYQKQEITKTKTETLGAAVVTEEPASNKVDGFAEVDTVSTDGSTSPSSSLTTKNGITDPYYIENPQAEDKEQWKANVVMFERNGVMLWKPTRQMYTAIKEYCLNGITAHPQYPKFIWKPKIVDVGCGCGVGSNVLSQEADFVWGIDKNAKSVQFAKECFERVKNQIYYSAQVSFDNLDIMEDTRDFAQFDLVVAIEIIEHVDDYRGFLSTLITKFSRRDKAGIFDRVNPTEFFISSPNRNNKSITKNTPRNKYHVREWTSSEYFNVLSEYFEHVVLHNTLLMEIPKEEYETTNHTPILVKAWGPKI